MSANYMVELLVLLPLPSPPLSRTHPVPDAGHAAAASDPSPPSPPVSAPWSPYRWRYGAPGPASSAPRPLCAPAPRVRARRWRASPLPWAQMPSLLEDQTLAAALHPAAHLIVSLSVALIVGVILRGQLHCGLSLSSFV